MLDALDLSLSLPKQEYKERKHWMQVRLLRLQRACWEAKVPTVVVFEGWDAAGKGTAIRQLTQRLEPRGFSLHATREPRTSELRLPWMWRFWVNLPNWGELAIFDRSWYGRVLVERVEGLVRKRQWRRAYEDIVSFERMLTDDRYVLVKFFLHITKKEQKRRFERIQSDPVSTWQVDDEDWEHHKNYDEYKVAVEEVLDKTHSECAPWTLVEATDRRWSRIKIFETLIRSMEEGLRRYGHAVPAEEPGDFENQDESDYLESDNGDD